MPQAQARNLVTISLVVVGVSVIAVTGVWRNVADWVRAKSTGKSTDTGAGGFMGTGVGLTPIVVNAGEPDPNPFGLSPYTGPNADRNTPNTPQLNDYQVQQLSGQGQQYPGISPTATGSFDPLGWLIGALGF